jgi:ribonuclease HI
VLAPIGAGQRLVAANVEPDMNRNRLELLAVVRGLEALEQPSQVTLLTRSRYVRRGIAEELCHWREANWRWERFGKLVSIRDLDLWQRVDRALEFHEVECLRWQWDEVSDELSQPHLLPAIASAADCSQKTDDAAGSRVRVRRLRPLRPRSRPLPLRPGAGQWGKGVLAAMSALGQPALSRTA